MEVIESNEVIGVLGNVTRHGANYHANYEEMPRQNDECSPNLLLEYEAS